MALYGADRAAGRWPGPTPAPGDRIAIAAYLGGSDAFDQASPTSPRPTPTRTSATTTRCVQAEKDGRITATVGSDRRGQRSADQHVADVVGRGTPTDASVLSVRDPLEQVAEHVIRAVVADGWGLRIGQLRYLPEGGGAYHWIASADDGRRWFVTCDDLATKPWLGSDRESVFEALRASYAAAMDLHRAGLEFVVPPVGALSGESAERVDERHSVSVFGYVDGTPGQWGQRVAPRTAQDLVRMVARLHRSPPVVRNVASRPDSTCQGATISRMR